jgi:glycosyltransferase involved in cell wall biosynthesis
VVPARNEAAGLPRLVDEIAGALRPLRDGDGPRPLAGFEILIIDDGSTDGTPEVLRGLAADYPELRAIVLADGVGQSSATMAGIRAARGGWVATLDADLQNDPADLVRLWEALPGHDVALGWRVDRRDDWSRRVISRWANRVRNAVLGQSIRDTGCSVRIFPRALALRLPSFRGVHRFLGPLLLREGCRLVQVPVGHRPRPHGRSHYSLWNRSLQVVVDLIGVAWLLRRPLRYRVLRAWDAGEIEGVALVGEVVGIANPGAED